MKEEDEKEKREPSKTIKDEGWESLNEFAKAINMKPQWIRKRYRDNRIVFDALLRGAKRK